MSAGKTCHGASRQTSTNHLQKPPTLHQAETGIEGTLHVARKWVLSETAVISRRLNDDNNNDNTAESQFSQD